MRTPRDVLPVLVESDIKQYQSFGWKTALIRDVIARKYGWRLLHGCIEALAKGDACPARCAEDCALLLASHRPQPGRSDGAGASRPGSGERK